MRLELDPDRLFPSEPRTRSIARGLYESTRNLPILSPHGHVDPKLLVDDSAFPDPGELFIRYDHYITRLLHSAGIDLSRLGIPDHDGAVEAAPEEVWQVFCENWRLYAGTASGYWLQNTFAELFGIVEHPSRENAGELFAQIQSKLCEPAYRPRSLFDRFRIEVLATTDDPLDELESHRTLAADPAFTGRVIPTFRPDAYIDPNNTAWSRSTARLAEWGGYEPTDFDAYLAALAERRRFFVANGAVSAEHGVLHALTVDLERAPQTLQDLTAARDELVALMQDARKLGRVDPGSADDVSRDAATLLGAVADGGQGSLLAALEAGAFRLTQLIGAINSEIRAYQSSESANSGSLDEARP